MTALLPFLFNASRWHDWRQALGDHGWNLLVIAAVLVGANIVFRRGLSHLFRAALGRARLRRDADPGSVQRRADTLSGTLNWVVGTFLFFLGVALVLDEVGIGVTALVAGLGVVGVALGLGAQTVVRDVIGGIFILVEDQFRVGDVVQVAGVSGEVVDINPRRTLVRDQDGNLHNVPNGAIQVATNMTQGFSRLNVDIRVGHSADLDKAIGTINAAGAEIYANRRDDFLTPPKVLGVQGLSEAGVDLRVTADVRPGSQWGLTGEFLQLVKGRLDREGILLTQSSQRTAAGGGR